MSTSSFTTTPPSAVTSPASRPPQPFPIDTRYVAPILVTLILLAGQLSYGILESYPKTLLAIGTSIVFEILLGLLFYGKVPHLASAYVSGISVGMIIRSPEFWPYALCAAISICSKYVLRVDGRHLWNPSNLGICALLFLALDTVAPLSVQWGNSLSPMIVIWIVGSFIIWRLRRFHICATYILSFVAFAALRNFITGHGFFAEVAAITGPPYQLFIFFMITDPKTTVQSKKGQMLVAFLVAFVESMIRLSGTYLPGWEKFASHAPYYALFLMGPSANLLEIIEKRRQSNRSLARAVS